MLQKSLYIAVVTCLFLTGCPVVSNDSVSLIKIVQIDGDDGVVYIGDTIQLETTPVDSSNPVDWSLRDADHPDSACATVDQNGLVIGGDMQCPSITVIAETPDGATASYPLEVTLDSQDEQTAEDGTINKKIN